MGLRSAEEMDDSVYVGGVPDEEDRNPSHRALSRVGDGCEPLLETKP